MPKILIGEQAKRKGMTHKEMSSKAGKAGKGKPKLRVDKTRKCTSKCQLWKSCPAKHLSHAGRITSPGTRKIVDYKGRCSLKDSSMRMKTMVKRIASGKAEDMDNLLREIYGDLYVASYGRKSAVKDKRDLLETGMKLRKTLHGDIKVLEGKMEIDQRLSGTSLAAIYEEALREDKKEPEKPKKKRKRAKKKKKAKGGG